MVPRPRGGLHVERAGVAATIGVAAIGTRPIDTTCIVIVKFLVRLHPRDNVLYLSWVGDCVGGAAHPHRQVGSRRRKRIPPRDPCCVPRGCAYIPFDGPSGQ